MKKVNDHAGNGKLCMWLERMNILRGCTKIRNSKIPVKGKQTWYKDLREDLEKKRESVCTVCGQSVCCCERNIPFANPFLHDFRCIYFAILQEKQLSPKQVELEVLDEDKTTDSIFEPINVRDVLEQIADDLNFLTIYTDRPAYFSEFAEKMYQENGLMVMIFQKESFFSSVRVKNSGEMPRRNAGEKLVIDFEWEGKRYEDQMNAGRYYIPIHKKVWYTEENLDITVPIGYNTVIVKGLQRKEKKPDCDRFEEAFYNL